MHEKFSDFGLSEELLMSLAAMGFEEPTQIQKIAIPPAMGGGDMIGVAQTGTGKTAAYGIPVIEKNVRGASRKPGAIVLVPTRELAIQVAEEMNRMGRDRGFVTAPIYGGQSIEWQLKSLKRGVDVVIGTPGRVIDHLERKSLVLSDVATVVLDEADEMLNMGFIDDIERILSHAPEDRQTLLFSATMPEEIVSISKRYMRSPKRVQVDTKELVVSKIKQIFYEVREADKFKALTRILDVQDPSLTLIFCHTKKDVNDLSAKLQQMGYAAGAIHGDFAQNIRDEMIRKFKNGSIDILVATDVAARGLDINDVSHVINYSIPQTPDTYVHRIGRTGRAGKSGMALTFVTPREYSHLRLIERTAKTKIEKGQLPSAALVKEAREKEIAEDVEETIESGKHKAFIPMVQGLIEKYGPEEAAAAILYLAAGEHEVEHIDEGSDVPMAGRHEMRRLMLTIGRKDQVKVGDIVRTLAAKAKIPGRYIGRIALFDKYSFVEVPASLAEQVVSSIGEIMIEGKRVTVKHAHPSSEGRGEGRSDSRGGSARPQRSGERGFHQRTGGDRTGMRRTSDRGGRKSY